MRTATRRKSWNHVEVLALTVAFLSGEEFQSARPRWQEAVDEMKQKYPDLLDDVFFTRREPLAPYSSQVDEFLKMLDKSNHSSLHNPVYQVRKIPEDSKATLQKRYRPLLRDHIDDIREMSKVLERHVSLKVK